MNKITLLNEEKNSQTSPVQLGQIYSRVNSKKELTYFIVCESDEGYHLFSLSNGERWSFCTTDINGVFGLFTGRNEFALVTEPIILTPVND